MSKARQGITRARLILNESKKWQQEHEISYSPDGTRFCLWGALKRACSAEDRGALYDAAAVVAQTIAPNSGHDPQWTIIKFNDAVGRTYDDVAQLLDKALETISTHSERMPT